LTQLIKSGPSNLKVLPFAIKQTDEGKKFVEDAAAQFNLSYSFLHVERGSLLVEHKLLFSDTNVVLAFESGQRALRDIPCSYYMQKKSDFFHSLVPIDEIQTAVENVKNNHFQDNVYIGVHMRMHDEVHDWSIVPPASSLPNQEATQFGVAATVNDFVRVLQGIILNWSRDNRQKFRIFLASNSREAKIEVMKHLPFIVTMDGFNLNRDSVGGVQCAFAEWLLLSQSSLIINTYGSSFATEAAVVNKVPLVGIHEHALMHHYDISLTFCGLLQYFRTYGTTGRKGNYVEGTFDRRSIDAVVLDLFESHSLDTWGFAEPVYALTAVNI
jgi:hypothetical protein